MKKFTVMYDEWTNGRRRQKFFVIPWSVVENHEEQCQKNHSQTLTRINERGGLDPIELYAVTSNISFSVARTRVTYEEALEWAMKHKL